MKRQDRLTKLIASGSFCVLLQGNDAYLNALQEELDRRFTCSSNVSRIELTCKINKHGQVADIHMTRADSADKVLRHSIYEALTKSPFKPLPDNYSNAIDVKLSFVQDSVNRRWQSTANLVAEHGIASWGTSSQSSFIAEQRAEFASRMTNSRIRSAVPAKPGKSSGPEKGKEELAAPKSAAKKKEEADPALQFTREPGKEQVFDLAERAHDLATKADYSAAREAVNKAIALDGKNAKLWYLKGWIEMQDKKSKDASDDYRKAKELDSSISNSVSLDLARSMAASGERQAACDMLWKIKHVSNQESAVEHKVDGVLVELGDERALQPSMIANASDQQVRAGAQLLFDKGSVYAASLATTLVQRNSTVDNESWAGYHFYKAAKYKEALEAYKRADVLGSHDPNYLRGIIACATQLGSLEDIQSAKKDYVSRFPDDERSKRYKEEIEYYQKDFKKIRERESEPVANNSDIPYFYMNSMPLKVFVPDIQRTTELWEVPPVAEIDYLGAVQRACDEWNSASGNRISFALVSSEDDANIEVHWVNDSAKMSHSFAAGTAGFATNAKGQRRSEVRLLVPTGKASATDNTESFFEVALHEFGHSLGLSHSSDPQDIMYFSTVRGPAKSLSESDKRRLLDLYKQR